MLKKQHLNHWKTIEFSLLVLSLSSELQQHPLLQGQPSRASLTFLFSYSDRVAWVRIFVFLVTKQLQLILWDFNLMNIIDLFIDLCWGLATRLNKVFWHLENCALLQKNGRFAVSECSVAWTTWFLLIPCYKHLV